MSDPRSRPDAAADATEAGDGPAEPTEPTESTEPTETVCPFCAVGCGLRYDDESGRVLVREGAVNRDGRLCSKGATAAEFLDADGRLVRPLVRGADGLEPATWEEALDRVEAGIEGVADRHGADALAFLGAPHCTNEENYLFQKLARALGTNNVDNRARVCHRSAATALWERLGSPGSTNGLDDLAGADALLVVGANPAAQQPVAFDSYVRPALDDGATLIHVDPRANRTTEAADVHLAPHPDGDADLVRALTALVVGDGAVDRGFVADRTTGFDGFERALADLDPESVAERAGVDPECARTAAEAFGRADRAAVLVGTGAEEDDHEGTATADALLDLLLATGNLGREGTGMHVLRGLNNEQGANDVGMRPGTLPGYEAVDDPAARARVADEWGFEPPASPGRSEIDAVDAFGDGVRGAYVFGENPAVNRTATQEAARRLESLDFLVVQDLFPTETTGHADVVLPASAWAEKSGTVTNLDRRVQRMRRGRSPPGDARSDLRILRDLGRRLVGEGFARDGPREVFAEITRVNPLYAGMTYDELGEGAARWPFPSDAESGTRVLHRDRFRNGERRVPFTDPTETSTGSEGGEASEPAASETLVLLTRSRVNEFDGDRDAGERSQAVAGRSAGVDGLHIHPEDAAERGVEHGEPVVVASGGERVRARAVRTRDVRSGTAFLDAANADPLLRTDEAGVRVAPTGGTGPTGQGDGSTPSGGP